MSPEAFALQAVALIESESIRAWARTPHNWPLIVGMAEKLAERNENPLRFATWLVCVAMGF